MTIGFPDVVGFAAKADAQIMHLANEISPADLWLDSAMLFCDRTATARWTCSASIVSPVCHNSFSLIIDLMRGVNLSSSAYPTTILRVCKFKGQ